MASPCSELDVAAAGCEQTILYSRSNSAGRKIETFKTDQADERAITSGRERRCLNLLDAPRQRRDCNHRARRIKSQSNRGRSSIGRAPRLQRGGWRFEPARLHFM